MARVDMALAQLEAQLVADPEAVLRSTDVSLADGRGRIGAVPEAWRERASARLWSVRSAAVDAVLDACDRGRGDHVVRNEGLELVVDEPCRMAAGERRRVAMRLLPLALRDAPRRAASILRELATPVTEPKLRSQLLAMLHGDANGIAWELLPDADLLALPPAVLARRLDPDGDAIERAVRLLLRTEAGRAELQRALATASVALAGEVLCLLPDELFVAAALPVFGRLAGNDAERATGLLGIAALPTAELQRELAVSIGIVPDGVLSGALVLRHVTDLGVDPARLDTPGRLWAPALDPSATAPLVAAAASVFAHGDLQPFVGRALAQRADADGLIATAAWIDSEDWGPALARLDGPAAMRVLGAVAVQMSFCPTDDAGLATAMLEHALAFGGIDDAIEVLGATPCGEAVVRGCLPQLEPDVAASVRVQLAEACDLDTATLQPATEVGVPRRLRLVLRHGIAAAVPLELRPLRQRMLTLRGVAP